MLRDDVSAAIKNLRSLYEQKNLILTKIKQLYLLEEQSLKAEFFDDFNSIMSDIDEIISKIESLNFNISAETDLLLRLTGMNKKSFEAFCKKSREQDIIDWKSAQKACEKTLEETSKLNSELIRQMETKSKDYSKSADELARLRHIKKFI